MKKIKQNITTYLSKAKLFFDDLEQIDKLLKESWSSYTLIIDEYELDSIDEIKSIEEKKDFHELEVRVRQPYFRLTIDQRRTYISSDDDPVCIGITEKIKPIFKKRTKILDDFHGFEWVLPMLLSWLNLFLSHYYKDLYPDSIEYIIFGLIILLCIGIVVFGNHKSIVFTTKKSNEESNYFTRNKDQVITILLSGLIGLATGIFIAWVRPRIF
jgi:hypothetical protein